MLATCQTSFKICYIFFFGYNESIEFGVKREKINGADGNARLGNQSAVQGPFTRWPPPTTEKLSAITVTTCAKLVVVVVVVVAAAVFVLCPTGR